MEADWRRDNYTGLAEDTSPYQKCGRERMQAEDELAPVKHALFGHNNLMRVINERVGE